MPYIPEENRAIFDKVVRKCIRNMPIDTSYGEMNYLLTSILGTFIQQNGVNYSTLQSVIGLLECVKLELYRRVVSMYEEEKIDANGDVDIFTELDEEIWGRRKITKCDEDNCDQKDWAIKPGSDGWGW
jgi:hypothetical protein